MNKGDVMAGAFVLTACLLLLGALQIVASCTRDVAKISAEVELACAQRGLVYFQGIGPNDPGRCGKPSK